MKIERVSLRIDGSREIHLFAFDFDSCFVNAPGVGRRLTMRPTPLLQLGSIVLHPAENGGMVYLQISLPHHLLHVARAKGIAQVPAHPPQNDLRLEVTPFEWMLFHHDWPSFSSFPPF